MRAAFLENSSLQVDRRRVDIVRIMNIPDVGGPEIYPVHMERLVRSFIHICNLSIIDCECVYFEGIDGLEGFLPSFLLEGNLALLLFMNMD